MLGGTILLANKPIKKIKSEIMKKTLFIIICLITSAVVKAQIDTTIWYPLQIGNYWEFSNNSGDFRNASAVIGDTTMTNGKVYKIIKHMSLNNPENISYSYKRIEDNAVLYNYSYGEEIKETDFTSGIMELWLWQNNIYKGLTYQFVGINDISGVTSLSKFFEYFSIDTNLVPPDTSVLMDVSEKYQKGIGPVLINAVPLTGAIINGVRYGIISDVENSFNRADKFMLLQNYPNPFNPTTTISYSIPKRGLVQLKVYDILGKEVATLVNEEKPAGKYSVKFNGSNLPSGVYFYNLRINNFVQSRKMILLR